MFVHKAIEPLLGPEDSIVYDGGDFCHFGRSFMPARLPYRWYYTPTLGMLGAALPTAMAAKLARPDSRVIACVGDGAFGFNGMELDTAVRHNLDIVIGGGQRLRLGNRPAYTTGPLRPRHSHRPAAHSLRLGSPGSGMLRRAGLKTQKTWPLPCSGRSTPAGRQS